jgi:hypothetical protein
LTIIAGSCHYVWAKSREQAEAKPVYQALDMRDLEEGKRISNDVDRRD